MSVWTRLASALVFPLHEAVKGHDSVARRRQLEASQYFDPARLSAERLRKLEKLIAAARTWVPYYERVLRSGPVARSLSEEALLDELPFLTKDVIRAQGEAMKSRRAKRLTRLTTGGSTGEPLAFFVGPARVSHDVAAKWRATRWWGVDIGDPEIVLWGSPIELGAQDRVRAWRDRLLRTRLLPAFRMSPEQMRGYLDTLRRVRPRMLFGYPSALALLAEFARGERIALHDLGIRVVFCTGETLMPTQRETLMSVFDASVANGYGSRDAGFIAHECPRGTLHLSAEDIIVEIVGSDGRRRPLGEEGEIVVTHLATADFPMIRYRTGDVGALSSASCPCGRTLPALAQVQGRSTDMIRAHDGTTMHALALIYVMRETSGIKAFKIVQESLDSLRVMVVPGEGFGSTARAQVEQGMKARLGPSTRVEIELVDRIEPEKSGKYRYVVSHA